MFTLKKCFTQKIYVFNVCIYVEKMHPYLGSISRSGKKNTKKKHCVFSCSSIRVQIPLFIYCCAKLEKQHREADVSRHHGGSKWGSWNPSDHHNAIELKGLKGSLNWVPIMLRDASPSGSGCNFSSLHWGKFCTKKKEKKKRAA